MSKVLPFTYYGSKWTRFNFINSRLVRTRQYIEPYGGAATILLNRDPVPVETYNDLNGDIPHFFRVLRDSPDELISQLKRTPYSREEYADCVQTRANGYQDCDDIERARVFFICIQQARSYSPNRDDGSQWKYGKLGGRKGNSVDQTTSQWKLRVDETLESIAGRLRDVQIECEPALDLIERHDTDVAMFYVDPPYVAETRGDSDVYSLEMDEPDHRDLAAVLHECEGYVAVSGYDSELYESLYSDWHRYSDREKSAHGSGTNGTRQEVLWTNYDADELGGRKIGNWGLPRRKGQQLTLAGAVE